MLGAGAEHQAPLLSQRPCRSSSRHERPGPVPSAAFGRGLLRGASRLRNRWAAARTRPRTRARRTCRRRGVLDRHGDPLDRLVGDRAAAGFRRMALLVRAVRRTYERTREHRAEAERLALLAEPAELVRVNPAIDLHVLRARLEILADRDHVHAVRSEVAHGLEDLVVRIADADDDARLRKQG